MYPNFANLMVNQIQIKHSNIACGQTAQFYRVHLKQMAFLFHHQLFDKNQHVALPHSPQLATKRPQQQIKILAQSHKLCNKVKR